MVEDRSVRAFFQDCTYEEHVAKRLTRITLKMKKLLVTFVITTLTFETGFVLCSSTQTDLGKRLQERKKNFYSGLCLSAHTFLSTLLTSFRHLVYVSRSNVRNSWPW